MDFEYPYTLKALADELHCEWRGDPDMEVQGLNEIHMVRPGDLVFVDHPKYYKKALRSEATVILINEDMEPPEGKGLLISDDPFRDFNSLSRRQRPFLAATSAIAEDAQVGDETVIQPNCFIGHGVKIGRNCLIHSNVSIYDGTVIGDDVVIGANAVLGSEAFYYKKRESGFDQLHSAGHLIIEDQVHVGAGCTIDRGVSGATRLGKGSKLDNSVQIGHDTVLGKNCLLAAQVGIAGCVTLGDEVTLWGQVGVSSGLSIGDKAVILAQSGIAKSLEGGRSYFGYPADEARKKYRELASIRLLPQIIEQL